MTGPGRNHEDDAAVRCASERFRLQTQVRRWQTNGLDWVKTNSRKVGPWKKVAISIARQVDIARSNAWVQLGRTILFVLDLLECLAFVIVWSARTAERDIFCRFAGMGMARIWCQLSSGLSRSIRSIARASEPA